MWTSNRRLRAAHPTRVTRAQQLGLAIAVLTCVGLAGCAPAETPPSSTAETDEIAPMRNGDLEAGTYLVNGFTVPFQVTVPDGWLMKDGWLLIKEPVNDQAVFLNFLNPYYVPTDACAWAGAITDVGATVEGFADAVAAQGTTTTTAPTDITVGDYPGVEFDLTVDDGVDITDCGEEHICIHSEVGYECTRYYQAVTRSETYRVLDLHGERAVLSVGQDAGVPASLIEEARAVFDSIEFASGG